MPNLVEIAENLDESAWKSMRRRRTLKAPPAKPRAKRPREKEAIVVKNNYLNKKLAGERIAEFDYSPGKCDRTYRVWCCTKRFICRAGKCDCSTRKNRSTSSTSPTRRSLPSQLGKLGEPCNYFQRTMRQIVCAGSTNVALAFVL